MFAAAVLILADTLIAKYLKGEASGWDVAFAALACIPMVKGLTTLGELSTAIKAGGLLGGGLHVLGAAKIAIVGMAAALRGGGGLIRTVARGISDGTDLFLREDASHLPVTPQLRDPPRLPPALRQASRRGSSSSCGHAKGGHYSDRKFRAGEKDGAGSSSVRLTQALQKSSMEACPLPN